MMEDRPITQAGGDAQSVPAELARTLDLLLFERYGDFQVLTEIVTRPDQIVGSGPNIVRLDNASEIWTRMLTRDIPGTVLIISDARQQRDEKDA